MKFKASWNTNSSWCRWSIPLYEGFRNGPYSCDLRATYFVSHGSTAVIRVTRPIVFGTQSTVGLHAGSLVSCHNFLNPYFFNKRSKPGRSLFRSERVILLVANLYAEAIEAVKSRAALSASSPELISVLAYTEAEASLWNFSQYVNFSAGSERSLVLTGSSMENYW
jgi:hypothetical protein